MFQENYEDTQNQTGYFGYPLMIFEHEDMLVPNTKFRERAAADEKTPFSGSDHTFRLEHSKYEIWIAAQQLGAGCIWKIDFQL